LNGANDTTSLKNRGYKVYYRGTGPQGLTATWYQGIGSVFPPYNGPPSGYVAANYNVVTEINDIDNWLVLPGLNIDKGDTLSFYSRSPDLLRGGPSDSITVSFSSIGDSIPEATSWVTLDDFEVNISDWELKNFIAPSGGTNARFAIRYKVVEGGPYGINSQYIGIDMITVHGSDITEINPPFFSLPDKYILDQNYPNPFNPETEISFALPEKEFVSLRIYNSLGKQVDLLINEIKAAGFYSLKYNAESLSSGVYFYEISTPNFTETKRMILLK